MYLDTHDMWMYLQDADGNYMATEGTYGEANAGHIVWEAPQSERYYVGIEAGLSSAEGTGTYTLTITVR